VRAEADAGVVAGADAGVDCGFTPEHHPPDFNGAVYADAGCGLAPASAEPWRDVKEVTIAEVRLEPTRTVLLVVLLDADKRRVLPIGRQLRYDVKLRTRQRGQIKLEEKNQLDGVFQITLPPNQRPDKGCVLVIHVEFGTGAGRVEDWVDDWMFPC
jgi:hypothetical protein